MTAHPKRAARYLTAPKTDDRANVAPFRGHVFAVYWKDSSGMESRVEVQAPTFAQAAWKVALGPEVGRAKNPKLIDVVRIRREDPQGKPPSILESEKDIQDRTDEEMRGG